MKRKGSVQPMVIVGAILLILVIVFGLFKMGVFEKDIAKDETPPVSDGVEKEEDEELIDDVDLEDEDQEEDKQEAEEVDYDDIAIGKLAPDFTLMNLDGEEVSLSDYKGKIVFLNFWATWCPHCVREMPDFNKLAAENDDMVILAVDVMEDKKLVEDYIEKGGYDFDVVLDEKGEVSMKYLISPLPTTYFIDAEGILLGRIEGALSWAHMNEILETVRQGE